ncbi:MAG: UvrD-helicase domain-containing protein [Elusimicrobia bacterium]|nr:UvrD-helicase domain-containing protein [Elusimicrobiota bacterium]
MDMPVSRNNKTAAPVLKSDTELKFPHALLISASAGSGKTYTLAQRYVQFLLSEKIPDHDLENILAVTFTNNAAKEMKTRILDWLKEIALKPDSQKMDETLRLVDISRADAQKKAAALVERVIDNYSDFHIQTIDSFMTRVMTASVNELDLPLNPEITMSYDDLIELALYSMFSRLGTDKDLKANIDTFLNILPEKGAYPWNPVLRIRDYFAAFLNEEGKTKGEIISDDSGAPGKAREQLWGDILRACGELKKKIKPELMKGSLAAAIENKDINAFISNYSFENWLLNGGRKNRTTGEFPVTPDTKKDLEYLSELVRQLLMADALSYFHPYTSIYSRFKAELERVKRGKTDIIHINDVNKKLSTYINANVAPDIYLKLGERINHYLIDEFQDTNKLQWDNFKPLIEESLSGQGSLFMVGDIKQAIFMFRNADYKIMRDLLTYAEGKKDHCDNLELASVGGRLELVNLPVNYRSGGKILDYVNAVFKHDLKNRKELAGEDVTELTSYEQAPQKERAAAGFVQTISLEAENITDDQVERGELLKIIESARKRYPLNEIAILAAKNKRIKPVVEWLTAAHIPVASLSSLDIRERRVIAELLALLKFLETPADDSAFAAFVTGEIFRKAASVARSELLEFIFQTRASHRSQVTGLKSQGISATYHNILYPHFKDHPKYSKYWARFFDELFRKTGYLPLYELCALIYLKFELFRHFPDESAFLSKFLNIVSKAQSAGITGVRGFLDFARGDDESRGTAFSIILPDYLEAARVMTFHKAKGLGFSVVINLIYEDRDLADVMYFDETPEGIKVYKIIKSAAAQLPELGRVYESKKTDGNVQDLNLLYVIETRAKEELYNLVIRKKRKNPSETVKPTDLFDNYLSEDMLQAAGDRLQVKKVDATFLKPLEPEPVYSANYEVVSAIPTLNAYAGSKEGELVHDILSHIITLPSFPLSHRSQGTSHKSDSSSGAQLPILASILEVIYQECAPRYPVKFNETKIVKTLAAFLALPEVKPWFEPKEGRIIKTETEFADKNGNLSRVDRLIIDKDLITIIDFKTGAEDAEKYAAQLKRYLALAAEIYKLPVKGLIAYVDLGKAVEIH